ncbi:MAG: esterase-like activity of phytase family protein [Planctomycetales bacterium]|nr:esterase-like activity of phytase family protein [Planctomycetales bacterium]
MTKRTRRDRRNQRYIEQLENRELMAADFFLQLLHASDLEGGVNAITEAPNFAAVVEGLELVGQQHGWSTVTLAAGDTYIPGPFYSASADPTVRNALRDVTGNAQAREGEGRADIAMMNVIGFDASVFGNHEFDPGTSALGTLLRPDIRDSNGDGELDETRWLGANFPYLSANLDFSHDSNLAALVASSDTIHDATDFVSNTEDLAAAAATPKIAPATVIEVDGQSIGVVGLTTPLLGQISSPGDTRVIGSGRNNLSELAKIIQPTIDRLLNERGVNKVILLSHLQQVSLEEQLAPLLSGVDVIIAGGSDTILADESDRLRTGDAAVANYPLWTHNADGDPTAVLSTDGQYSYVGQFVIGFDEQGIIQTDTFDATVSGPYATDDQGVTDVWSVANPDADPFGAGTKGQRVATMTSAVQGVVTEKDSFVFGQSSVFLEGRRTAVRTQETNLGNLTADANLAAARAIDSSVLVSIKNGGGIRTEIGIVDGFTGELLPTSANPLSGKSIGEVSQLDIENSLRFNNALSLVTVTAEGLKRLLEHGVADTRIGATPGRFPQIGGLRFSYDPGQQAQELDADGTVAKIGERVRNVAIVDDAGQTVDAIVRDGQVVGDAQRSIRIVTLNFLAGGGDGYPFPTVGTDRVDLTVDGMALGEQAALSDYLSTNYSSTPFNVADTPIELDSRIQNLAARSDTILAPQPLNVTHLSSYGTGQFDAAAAEIVAYDPASQRLFFTEGDAAMIGVLDISVPQQPWLVTSIDVSKFGDGPTSVSVSHGIVAVAVTGAEQLDNGSVVMFDIDGRFLKQVPVGNLPDMVTFTPDGSKLLVADEGEPQSLDFEEIVAARFATFNASLNRSAEGELIADLSGRDDPQAQNVAEIIQRTQPDVLLINEFDYDADGEAAMLFRQNYLQVPQNGQKPAYYPYVYAAPSNTGVESGFDLNNDGTVGGGNDAFGFGNFAGQYGMVLYSRYPLMTDQVRTFQTFLWKDMPGAMLPDDPATPEPADWYSAEELDVLRLSSKSHWDVPVNINGTIVHVLASHPTPPVFDGPEDANGKRNHDEIRFWSDYVTPGSGDYIIDDNGLSGGIAPSSRFVIMGDMNADPFDGDSSENAIWQLLGNPMINTSDVPSSAGAVEASERQGENNIDHADSPQYDTADFAETSFGGPGNVRVDYVLPSTDLAIVNSGVYWEVADSPEYRLATDFPPSSSDHRLVYSDLETRGIDPPGGVSIIDVSDGLDSATAHTIDFSSLIGREDELRTKGVRIFPGTTAWHDLEPEYISVSADGTRAMVTLQEANAIAVIDVQHETLLDVLPLGLKDHLLGQPSIENYPVLDLPNLEGTTPTGQAISLGGFSGLYYAGINSENGNLRFVTIPDRGPNPETGSWDADGDGVAETVRPFALPDYQARIVTLELDQAMGSVSVVDQMMLTRTSPDDATQTVPITGRSNIFRDVNGTQVDEFPIDLQGQPLPLDPFGGDFEGIAIEPATDDIPLSYWSVDEYRPAIYHFDASGNLIDRFIPVGTAALAGQAEGTYGTETLPADYLKRRANRGFEALALDAANHTLYAFIQTPLANPNTAASNASDNIRILGIDTQTGEVVAEYVYALEDISTSVTPTGRVDKIGDAVWLGNGQMYVVERDSGVGATSRKPLFRIDLKGATNLRDAVAHPLLAGKSLEQHSIDQLIDLGIQPVNKVKIANLPSLGYVEGDKVEGVALLPDGSLAIINDNDFALEPVELFDEAGQPLYGGGVVPQEAPTREVLGILQFDQANGLDGSDADRRVNIASYPIFGVYMPDEIATFQIAGQTYYVTANEGDARDENVRLATVTLDPAVFPNAAELQAADQLGRLNISSVNGDLDGDGDYDQIWAYGGRSFTVWDAAGNLVFDSGSDIETMLGYVSPSFFNVDSVSPTFDVRSDDKGPEPEAIATGVVGSRVYTFVGLERQGGFMVYDVTDPADISFVQYVNYRNFNAVPDSAESLDLAVESMLLIPAAQSPTGHPILVTANETSGTVSLFTLDTPYRAGDFNHDQVVDQHDLDVLGIGISQLDSRFDVNEDGRVNSQDHSAFLARLYSAAIGDANLDGVFDSADLVEAFSHGLYEDNVPHNATWSAGDWDGDGDFTTGDLVVAFQRGRYQSDSAEAATRINAQSFDKAFATDGDGASDLLSDLSLDGVKRRSRGWVA